MEKPTKCQDCGREIEGEEVIRRSFRLDEDVVQCPECYDVENEAMGNLRFCGVI